MADGAATCYSALSATVGSTLAARRAGITLAANAATASVITATANTRRSLTSMRNTNISLSELSRRRCGDAAKASPPPTRLYIASASAPSTTPLLE